MVDKEVEVVETVEDIRESENLENAIWCEQDADEAHMWRCQETSRIGSSSATAYHV